MHPTFFGSSARPLYGVLHAPTGQPRDTGVLLFYPGIQEYGTRHWAFRNLATALSARGFHVMRFDYRGTGDSAGDPDESTVEACVDDALVAYDELRDATGTGSTSFVGLRLGAAIAARVAAAGKASRDLVLWDPVVNGARYLADLQRMDATQRLRLLHELRPPAGELGGFPFPRDVQASIEQVDLCRLEWPAGPRIATFLSEPSEDAAELDAALRARGRVATQTLVRSEQRGASADGSAAILGTAIVQAIVEHMVAA
jgi:pimeloyl-ACP methyl ester carboxylesterase